MGMADTPLPREPGLEILFKAGGDWLLAYALQQTGHLQQQVSLTGNNEYRLHIRKARSRGGHEDRLIK